MRKRELTGASLSEVHQSIETKHRKGWRKIFSFIGPAYLISVGYMDPGNWATDLAGGSKYGYTLIWVLLMSNLMALLLQGLSARLGIVRGRDLAQANREEYPRVVNFVLYILAEIAIAACDLAEVLGMAIGIQLLTGLPLVWGVSITVLDTFLLLYLQKLGMRKMEAFIVALVLIISISFFIEIALAKPVASEIAKGFIPSLPDAEALYIAIGIIGATVMPHNLYLHSALVQSRKFDRTDEGIKQAIRFNRIDTTVALNVAFLVNASILIVAAAVFFKSGNMQVAEIHEAHRLLPSFLGNAAPILFAVALIAAGQSSTVTGTLAGQIVMEGYLHLRINPWLRRLITRLIAIIPALIVIIIYGEDEVDALLVLSQVVLSLQLGFAIIPLIHFVSDKKTMGKFVIKPLTKIMAWLIASILIYLNLKMLINEASPIFMNGSFLWKSVISLFLIFFALLLLYIIVFPFMHKNKKEEEVKIHGDIPLLNLDALPAFSRIAIALDFTDSDDKIIASALAQGGKEATYILVHVVESVSAGFLGKQSEDLETQQDIGRLDAYGKQLQQNGYQAFGFIGYNKRVKEIARIVNENAADLLVIGAHGHKGLKDFLYGETVNAVRHQINVPVLVVRVNKDANKKTL